MSKFEDSAQQLAHGGLHSRVSLSSQLGRFRSSGLQPSPSSSSSSSSTVPGLIGRSSEQRTLELLALLDSKLAQVDAEANAGKATTHNRASDSAGGALALTDADYRSVLDRLIQQEKQEGEKLQLALNGALDSARASQSIATSREIWRVTSS